MRVHRARTGARRTRAADAARVEESEMTTRSGPFWDGVEGRAPMPRAAATLGFELIAADV